MRQMYLSLAATEPGELWPLVRAAEDAYQQSRVSIARLGMRPHAEAEMVTRPKRQTTSCSRRYGMYART
jgi:hypothetical protein